MLITKTSPPSTTNISDTRLARFSVAPLDTLTDTYPTSSAFRCSWACRPEAAADGGAGAAAAAGLAGASRRTGTVTSANPPSAGDVRWRTCIRLWRLLVCDGCSSAWSWPSSRSWQTNVSRAPVRS